MMATVLAWELFLEMADSTGKSSKWAISSGGSKKIQNYSLNIFYLNLTLQRLPRVLIKFSR